MRFVHQLVGVGFVAAFAVQGIGCSQPQTSGDAPAADDSLLGAQTVYSSTGGWSAASGGLVFISQRWGGGFQYNSYAGKATFTGPANSTHKAGVCTLRMIGTQSSEFIRCSTSLSGSQLNPTCGTPPTGGQNYCLDIYHDGNAYCYYRPGPTTSWCWGSPANGGSPVTMSSTGSMTQYTPTWEEQGSPGAYYVTQACLDVSNCDNATSIDWTYGPTFVGCVDGYCN